MRHVLIVDEKITAEELLAWKLEDDLFWDNYTGITPEYWEQRYDFSEYPTVWDSDGDARPDPEWVTRLTDEVHAKYHDFGTDFVMLLVHEDNWRSAGPLFDQLRAEAGFKPKNGIWGTNFSGIYRNYHVQYCRWDRDNPANVFGTMYHERHHALDALIKTEIGVDIRPLIGVENWDRGCTHGAEKPWVYIRHKENVDALKRIAPYLKLALNKRQKRHDERLRKMNLIISLLGQVVYWLRKRLNAKDGVSASL